MLLTQERDRHPCGPVPFPLSQILVIQLFSPVFQVVQIPQRPLPQGEVHGDIQHGLLLVAGLRQGLAGGVVGAALAAVVEALFVPHIVAVEGVHHVLHGPGPHVDNVASVGRMQELGATDFYIYEVQSDGRYTQVAHYTREKYPVLIKKDVSQAIIQMTYQGVVGKKYYAEAKCYAKNGSGSGTRWVSSSIVTAT